jgi:predicted flap endonuclease-1-like 5' DNA nuclease
LIPNWFWMLLIFLPLGTLTWWFLRWFFLPSYKRTSSVEIDTPRSSGVPLPLLKDDFTILKGIGPKTAAGIHQAGIMTFEQLGLMSLEELVQILKAQGLPSSNADSWKEQAVLAAAEDWEGLQKIQK